MALAVLPGRNGIIMKSNIEMAIFVVAQVFFDMAVTVVLFRQMIGG